MLSTPVVVDGDKLTLRMRVESAGVEPLAAAHVRVRLLVAEDQDHRNGTAMLEGLAIASGRAGTDEVVEVAWHGGRSGPVQRALLGLHVRLEMTASAGVAMFSFGFE